MSIPTYDRPTNRTEFLQAFRDYLDINNAISNRSIASIAQLNRYLDIALDKLSSRRPVEGQTAILTITDGYTDVVLPIDWLTGNQANERILLAIERGENPLNLEDDYSSLQFMEPPVAYFNNAYNLAYGNRFDPINSNLSKPIRRPNPPQGRPTITRKWVDGAYLPVWVLRQSLPGQQVQVRYFARHRVEDGDTNIDSINTLQAEDESIIYEIMQILCVKGQSFSVSRRSIINNSTAINPLDYLKGADELINMILARITPVGIRKTK